MISLTTLRCKTEEIQKQTTHYSKDIYQITLLEI